MIDVIIPAYNAHETIKQTIYSIAYQTIADKVNVIVVNDCSKEDYKKEIELFEKIINIKEVKTPKNSGPGVARQLGIDSSNSKYIVFIDSDDIFTSTFALADLLKTIEESDSDIVISSFYEEIGMFKMPHFNDVVWLHGKIYKREFLEKNNIRFNETRSNEDNGFNQQCIMCEPKRKVWNEFTYLWRYNEKSITRRNNHEYNNSSIYWLFYNIRDAIEKAIKENRDSNKIGKLAFSTIYDSYIYYIDYCDREDCEKIVGEVQKLYKIYIDNQISNKEKIEIIKRQNECLVDEHNEEYIYLPKLTFEEYLKEINKGGK